MICYYCGNELVEAPKDKIFTCYHCPGKVSFHLDNGNLSACVYSTYINEQYFIVTCTFQYYTTTIFKVLSSIQIKENDTQLPSFTNKDPINNVVTIDYIPDLNPWNVKDFVQRILNIQAFI